MDDRGMDEWTGWILDGWLVEYWMDGRMDDGWMDGGEVCRAGGVQGPSRHLATVLYVQFIPAFYFNVLLKVQCKVSRFISMFHE